MENTGPLRHIADAMVFDFGKVNVRDEFVAGLTVFLASSYILFLNPQIMGDAGMNLEGAFFATALAAAVGTFIIAMVANKPYIIAPGMTLNIFFTYSLVKFYGISWEVALAAAIFSGVILFALSLTKIRVWFSRAIPAALKQGILGGVGLLLVFVGLIRSHIVVASTQTIITLGNFLSPQAVLALFGLLITSLLFIRKVRGAFLFGILLTTVLSIVAFSTPTAGFQFFGIPYNLSSVAFKFDIAGLTNSGMLTVVIAIFMVMFFDTLGTSAALMAREGKRAGERDLENIMISDSLATIFGGMLGASPQTVYAESAAAQDSGGKTGLTAIFASVFFLLSLFFYPLVKLVPMEATAPVIILVGILMLGSVKNIGMKDYSECIPAFFCLAAIPLTFSISYGIGAAVIIYVLLKIFAGKMRDVHLGMYITAVLFLLDFIGVF